MPQKVQNKPSLEEPFEYFDLLYPTLKRDREKIRTKMIGRSPFSIAPYSILDYIFSPKTGKRAPICKTVIVENRYIDKDHSKAVSIFYSRSFRSVPKECVRLHFFSRRLTAPDVSNLEKHNDAYLGFCVLRPLSGRKIGRTVLTRQRYDPTTEFPTCEGTFEVNIGGSKLTIKGSIFMEQDTMVAACASVALWMSTANICRSYGLIECSTSEITTIANEYLCQNRPMPSVGLLPDQMIHALRSMNYDPIFIEARSQEQIKHDIYSYVESQIPPILLCRLATGGNHAIVAVGHGYERPLDNPLYYQTDWLDEEPLLFARSSAWVPCFYINDDQRGIYRKLTFIKPDLTEIINHITAAHPDTQIDQEELGQWRCPVSIDLDMPNAGKEYQGNKQIANIYAIIVPLSQNVLLNAEQAEQKAALLIRYLHWLHKEPLPKNLVLRTYAIPSNDYKRMIEKRRIDDFVKQLYRGKPMPKWIWITEVSSTDSYNSPDPLKWLIKGEIIIDATGNPLSPDFIALHYIMNNIAIISTMKPDHQGPEQALNDFWYSKNDDPYPGWVR